MYISIILVWKLGPGTDLRFVSACGCKASAPAEDPAEVASTSLLTVNPHQVFLLHLLPPVILVAEESQVPALLCKLKPRRCCHFV